MTAAGDAAPEVAPGIAPVGAPALVRRHLPTVLHLRSSGGVFGADRVVLDLCAELPGLGYRAVVVPIVEPGGAGSELTAAAAAAGLPVRPLRLRGRFDWRGAGLLGRLGGIEGAAILHGHDYKSNALIAAARPASARRVATLHGRVSTDWKLRLYEAADARIVARRFDRMICVSAAMRAAECRRGLDPALIHNGIDPAPFAGGGEGSRAELGLPAGAEVVGAVGRLSAEKRFDILVRAVAELAAARPRLHLVLVGNGPERRALERLGRELGLAERVHFAGVRRDMPAIYPLFDVFCLPSEREGLPIALLEALAAGRAALVTAVGGVPDVVGNWAEPAALAVPPGDVRALSAGLSTLLASAELRHRLGARGRARVETHFSRRAMAAKTARLYGELLGAGGEDGAGC